MNASLEMRIRALIAAKRLGLTKTPDRWTQLLDNGWQLQYKGHCVWNSDCTYQWIKPDGDKHGCVCHHTPAEKGYISVVVCDQGHYGSDYCSECDYYLKDHDNYSKCPSCLCVFTDVRDSGMNFGSSDF